MERVQGDCHKHSKKFNDPKQARVNPSNKLVNRLDDWHFLCAHYLSCQFSGDLHLLIFLDVTSFLLFVCNILIVCMQEQSRTNKAARAKQPNNHRCRSKSSFLELQHELIEQRDQPVDHVELFRETYANKSGQFILQAAANVHVSL